MLDKVVVVRELVRGLGGDIDEGLYVDGRQALAWLPSPEGYSRKEGEREECIGGRSRGGGLDEGTTDDVDIGIDFTNNDVGGEVQGILGTWRQEYSVIDGELNNWTGLPLPIVGVAGQMSRAGVNIKLIWESEISSPFSGWCKLATCGRAVEITRNLSCCFLGGSEIEAECSRTAGPTFTLWYGRDIQS